VGTQSHLLSVITFLPLLGVPALLFLRSEDHTWIRRIALAISLVELAASALLLPGFRMGEADYQSPTGSVPPSTITSASMV
jgi:NADH:ubiquinone oxidoreductase subunit 4 (subunit M)